MAVPTFNEWIGRKLHEIKLGSDGSRDNQATQTSHATAQVAQNWLSQDQNADVQAQLIQGMGNKSALAPRLMDAGAEAIEKAPGNMGKTTTAPNVAAFIQSNLGLPNIIKPPKPTQVKMMRRHMRKKMRPQ